MMADSPLLSKSKIFALEIIKVCNEVKSAKRESVLTNQLVRSGTSIGANIREAFYGHSKADFISKLQIALKECSHSKIKTLTSVFSRDHKIPIIRQDGRDFFDMAVCGRAGRPAPTEHQRTNTARRGRTPGRPPVTVQVPATPL